MNIVKIGGMEIRLPITGMLVPRSRSLYMEKRDIHTGSLQPRSSHFKKCFLCNKYSDVLRDLKPVKNEEYAQILKRRTVEHINGTKQFYCCVFDDGVKKEFCYCCYGQCHVVRTHMATKFVKKTVLKLK